MEFSKQHHATPLLHSPTLLIGFLRIIAHFLTHDDVATQTTSTVDSHVDRLQRQLLPVAGLQLREHFVFPPCGFQLTRQPLAWLLRITATPFPGDCLLGDNHVLVLGRLP
jgi:hypothetical protein